MNEFLKATIIRAVRTMAQTMIATIGSAAVLSEVNWPVVYSASVLAGILSILMSISSGLPEAELAEDLKDDDDDIWVEFEDDADEDPYEGEEGGSNEVE